MVIICSAPPISRPIRFRDIKRLAVMNSTFQRIKVWRSRRQLRSLQKWEQIRAEGKRWFVFRTAVTYGLTVVGMMDAYDYFFGGEHSSISLLLLIFYLLVGIFIASDAWSNREAKYQNALIEARVKASPSGQLPPDNSPLQITADSRSV